MEGGADALAAAEELEAARAVSLAAGAADLTRAEDAEKAAARVAQLSDVVAAAGAMDVVEGAAILAASEDVGTISALIGVMSADDLEEGMKLARISGELRAASEITKRLEMPLLAKFLRRRSTQLDHLAVDAVVHLELKRPKVSKPVEVDLRASSSTKRQAGTPVPR